MTQYRPVLQDDPAAEEKVTKGEEGPVTYSPHARTSRLYLFFVGGGLILALGVLLLMVWMVDVEKYRPQIIATLENITGHQVSLGEVALSPTGGLFTLELRDLQIHALDPKEPPFLLVKKVQIGLTPLSFFYEKAQHEAGGWHPQLDISSVTFVRPQVNLIRRSGVQLMHQAQDTAQRSDRKIEREFGLGLTELSIGSIKVQSGVMTLLDWENPNGSSLVFDRIQAGIHTLSPHRPSPISVSARFQSVPFTVNGQVGPLPESLELTALPVLLSLEAKSAELSPLTRAFTQSFPSLPRTMDIRGARGYFSTLFYGTLQEGMQTSSRLELDELTVDLFAKGKHHPPDDQQLVEKKSQEGAGVGTTKRQKGGAGEMDGPILPPVLWNKAAKMPMDWAFRQKSILRTVQGNLSFQIEEFFFYLDRKPILDVKGLLSYGKDSPLDLQIKTLGMVSLERFPRGFIPILSSGALQGMLHIHGSWPDSIIFDTRLDLSQVSLSLSPPFLDSLLSTQEHHVDHRPSFMETTMLWMQKKGLHKDVGTPLFLHLNMVREKGRYGRAGRGRDSLVLEDLVLSRSPILSPSTPRNRLHFSGALQPMMHLDMVGSWELSLLKDLLPEVEGLGLSGLAQMQVTLSDEWDRTEGLHEAGGSPVLEGYLRSDYGHLYGVSFQDFFARVALENNSLHFSGVELRTGSGRLDGYLLADFAEPQVSYQTLFAFSGISVEKWIRKPHRDAFHLEGLAFGEGELYGHLDDSFFPTEPFFGNIHLAIEPGRVTGVHGTGTDGDLFLKPPDDVHVILGAEGMVPAKDDALQERVEREKISREGSMGRGEGGRFEVNLANPKKAFYWDQLEMDIRLHNTLVSFDAFQLKAAGLQIAGSGAWELSGNHWFDLDIRSSLKTEKINRFSAQIKGDRHKTVYQPRKKQVGTK